MRFGVPRSLSPSPERQSFTVISDSDDSDSDSGYSSSEAGGSTSNSSYNSFCYDSESEVPPPPPRKAVPPLRTSEQRYIEDTVAAIRLRTRHNDPYEQWGKQTRKEAFRTARRHQATLESQIHTIHDQNALEHMKHREEMHAKQMADIQAALGSLKVHQQKEQEKLKEEWSKRDKRLWQRVEAVIQFEEGKVREALEKERAIREAEERKRKEEELKKRLEEEKRRAEEEERVMKEEEKKRKEEEAERERKRAAEEEVEEERLMVERLKNEEGERRALGMTSADEDWRYAREMLHTIKTGPMKTVKSTKELKSIWSAARRQITPKIGQLTRDSEAVSIISNQIRQILVPPNPHPQPVYLALLSSLAKSILLQAETEVTAEKRSALPLALVTTNLLSSLPSFPDVFYAKLVQRAGGWIIPSGVPGRDWDGTPWANEDERSKAMGYRKGNGAGLETTLEYTTRIGGMMRVYFHILKAPVENPLDKRFQLPRYWVWFARMLSSKGLLGAGVAPELIYVALDVFGLEAKGVWGQQWIKMLALLYEGATSGFDKDRLIGGITGEGKAARVRVLLEVERIMTS